MASNTNSSKTVTLFGVVAGVVIASIIWAVFIF